MINYNAASRTYDNTRSYSDTIIEYFREKISFTPSTAILDFGCGTGNYLDRMQRRFGCVCGGVEPSDGMREIAKAKNGLLDVRKGDHRGIPFDDNRFDFAFMTDVVHHIPDLGKMFSELERVLRPGAMLCIVTESHQQIESRFYNRYFPSLEKKEKERYPDVPEIIEAALHGGFSHDETRVLQASGPTVVSESFIRNAAEKNFSMFRRLEEREFQEGLAKLKGDLGKTFERSSAGETLIWLRKG